MADQSPTPQSAGSGLAPNVASLLCYLCTWITGIIFLLIEKENRDVKFHAWQAIFIGVGEIAALMILWILSWIPILGYLFYFSFWLVLFGEFGLRIFLMMKAYQGEKVRLPYMGDLAERQAVS